jgi:uroporphyrinogen decarboxylase
VTNFQRIESVLSGRWPDRPPFSFWYHFQPDQVAGPAAVQGHLDHLEKYGLDFLKVMNDNPYPDRRLVRDIGDLQNMTALRGDEDGFAEQLELLSELKAKTRGKVPLITTIFNAWMVLRRMVQPPTGHQPPNLDAASDAPSAWIRQAAAGDVAAVAAALRTIGNSLGRFAAMCLQAGADGIFLSVRDDWVEVGRRPPAPSLYEQLVRQTDLEILSAASVARFNIVHACGRPINFRAFAEYPAAILNWADRAAGPSIADVLDWVRPAICGGVDNLGTLVSGTPRDVAAEVADALAQAGDRPILVAPGCTFDPARVPEGNLHALADAVRAWRRAS